MRALLAILVAGVAGCLVERAAPNPFEDACDRDAACNGGVCARDGQCHPASDVRAAHVRWTIAGQEAGAASCDPGWRLEISFAVPGSDQHLSYSPVVCEQGSFTVDKLPRTYTQVTLGDRRAGLRTAEIDAATGDAVLDLPR